MAGVVYGNCPRQDSFLKNMKMARLDTGTNGPEGPTGFTLIELLVVTYQSESGEFDPSITGFLSYGFNQVGIFGVPVSPGSYVQKPFKATNASRPSEMVMMTDVSGSNDPANCSAGDLTGDAAWL